MNSGQTISDLIKKRSSLGTDVLTLERCWEGQNWFSLKASLCYINHAGWKGHPSHSLGATHYVLEGYWKQNKITERKVCWVCRVQGEAAAAGEKVNAIQMFHLNCQLKNERQTV